jgi:SAM-dependent methyltransferase
MSVTREDPAPAVGKPGAVPARGGGADEPDAGEERFRAFERAAHDRLARTYRDFFTRVTARAIEPLLAQAEVGPGRRVLDVATGPGIVTAAAAGRGAAVVGLDLSPVMIALARERYSHLVFQEGDAEDLPFGDAAFEAVVCNFGLGHFPNAARAVAECVRVLAPAGRLAISWWNTPDVSRLHGVFFESIDEVGAMPPDDLPPGPPIFRYSNDAALATLLAAAGLEVTPPTTVSAVQLLGSPGDLWHGALNSMVRLAALIHGQPKAVQDQIRAAFQRRVQPYVEPAGVRIPVSFKIASGIKPARAASQ